MRIYFKLPQHLIDNISTSLGGIINSNDIDTLHLTDEAKGILLQVSDFVKQRYNLFVNEIENEEVGNIEANTLIDLTDPKPKVLQTCYSEGLTEKMKYSVTPEDLDRLAAIIGSR